MTKDLSVLCISQEHTIRDAIEMLNRNERGIVLITDDQRRLLGTITDGDIRRAILAGSELDTQVRDLLIKKPESLYPSPITAPVEANPDELLRLMRKYGVQQIPIVNQEDQVVDLVTMEDLLSDDNLPLQAVIMAGGFGTRLRPLTEELPKPMLPIGDQPVMELMLERLGRAGIKRVNITTHYLPEKIQEYFGNGQSFGVELNYVNEERPLGTAGAIGLMEPADTPLLVINGDILTKIDFRAMLKYHRKHEADLTVGVRQYDLEVPYGVLECEGPYVRGLQEKPKYNFLVNAGIYLLSPSVYEYIPSDRKFDMTDLIERLLEDERRVASFPIVEYWLDIGEPADYQQAQEDLRNGKV
jgi:dTDP-glucose pyrophosphorylase/CBS domain-containing protein